MVHFSLNTGFPHCPEVECSYEVFHNPKQCKAKKQLPFFIKVKIHKSQDMETS